MELSINLGLPLAPATTDRKLFEELLPIYVALRNVAAALDSYTGTVSPDPTFWGDAGAQIRVNGMAKVYARFYEDATVGQTMSFMASSGEVQVRKAQHGSYRCHGFVSQRNTAAGEYGEIVLLGQFPPFPAGTLIPGTTYQQSTTAGTLMPYSGTGFQSVGFALDDTTLFFNPSYQP